MSLKLPESIPIPQTGLGGLLGQGLGQGISSGLQGLLQDYHKDKEQKKTGSALAQIVGKPEMAEAFSKLPPDLMKEVTKDIFAGQREQQKISPEQLDAKQKQERYVGVANRIEELIQPGLKSRTPFTAQGRERAAEINSLGEQMFAAVRGDIIKGNMNQKVFDFLKKRVTASASDTNATIKGKLSGFRQIIGLQDYSNLTKNDIKRVIDTNVRMTQSQTGEGEERGKRMVQMIAPDGSTARVPYNSDIMKKALQAGAKIQRGR